MTEHQGAAVIVILKCGLAAFTLAALAGALSLITPILGVVVGLAALAIALAGIFTSTGTTDDKADRYPQV